MAVKSVYKISLPIFLILFLVHTISSTAQTTNNQDLNNTQLWTDITLNKPLNNRWSIVGDFGTRTSVNTNNWWQFYIRPGTNYKLSPIYNFTFGVGSFIMTTNDITNFFEFRFYQDLNINWPKLGFLAFTHRIRFEERFFNYSDSSIQDDFSFRGRYLIGTRTNKFGLGEKKQWTLFSSFEPFWSLNSNSAFHINNFRWDTAISYHINSQLRIELHYILQTPEVPLFNKTNYYENLFRIRVFKNL